MTAHWSFEEDPDFGEAWRLAEPATMTTPERGYALWRAVNHVLDRNVPGCLVECGVWRGGSALLIALALARRGARDRQLILFDTFAGMTSPGTEDVDLRGDHASMIVKGERGAAAADLVRARADLDTVKAVVGQAGLDPRSVRYVAGDVRETLARTQTLAIALLRLDTDFYDSTLEELLRLYPRLSEGAPVILDGYGRWRGARRAVDDYFAAAQDDPPMLWPIDYTGRAFLKTTAPSDVEIARYDYAPPGLPDPKLLRRFPTARPMNPWTVGWPYLRPHTPHLYRSDTRNPGPHHIGNASYEEALCLHAVATQFAGRRGLEIGTHFGWTAAHLCAAGLSMDLVDPAFADPARREAVAAVVAPDSRLCPHASPYGMDEVAAARDAAWSFVFIDGDHDGDAPLEDALAVEPHCAPDAAIMFHDMTSPHVARGLEALAERGWSTRLFNTMQILGLAWRGDVAIPVHRPDPNTPLIYDAHLARWSD